MEEVGFDCEFEMLTTRCMPLITLHAIPNTEPSQHNHPCSRERALFSAPGVLGQAEDCQLQGYLNLIQTDGTITWQARPLGASCCCRASSSGSCCDAGIGRAVARCAYSYRCCAQHLPLDSSRHGKAVATSLSRGPDTGDTRRTPLLRWPKRPSPSSWNARLES